MPPSRGEADDMGKTREFLTGLIIWKYERGTIAYDIMVALILLFVFFVPKSCLVEKTPPAKTAPAAPAAAANK